MSNNQKTSKQISEVSKGISSSNIEKIAKLYSKSSKSTSFQMRFCRRETRAQATLKNASKYLSKKSRTMISSTEKSVEHNVLVNVKKGKGRPAKYSTRKCSGCNKVYSKPVYCHRHMERTKGRCWYQTNIVPQNGQWKCGLKCYGAGLATKDSLIRHYLTQHPPAAILALGLRIDEAAHRFEDAATRKTYFEVLAMKLGTKERKGEDWLSFQEAMMEVKSIK